MNIIILGGFLGSGKTTTLMQFARFLVDTSGSDSEYKVVILENEIGKIGIDDQYLRSSGLTVNNLFAGCACCTVSSELVSSVNEIIRKMGPEWLIIETTGIAYPGLMRENMQNALSLDSRICVLIDASRWARLRIPMETLLRGQIECADLVVINKIDLVDEEILQNVEQDIRGFNEDVPIIRISALSDVSPEIWSGIAGIRSI